MNVLVYNGPEVLQTSASRTITSLRSILYPNYTVQAIAHQSFVSSPWSSTCALLVFPACRLTLSPSISSSIKSFVENGGAFLGLRAGMRIGGLLGGAGLDYSLRLQDPASGSILYCTFPPSEESTFTLAPIKISGEDVASPVCQTKVVDFDGTEQARNVKVVARYSADNTVAGALAAVGSGRIVLWGLHLETIVNSEVSGLPINEAHEAETRRQRIFRSTLSALRLKLPKSDPNSPTHPLPQFLLASREPIVSQIFDALSLKLPGQFKDDRDVFSFHPASDAEDLLLQSRTASQADDVRHVIAYTDGSLPSMDLTPFFSPQVYFSELSSARSKIGQSTITTNWGFGDAMFYGEAITSTQTLLDKNPHFLSLLPSPTLSIATHQLAGRGRGGNSWVSPTGCLQFSLRLRLSLSNFTASRLVFIQYLFALAVVEACRDDSVLGEWGDRVRIKWPNDVYIIGDGESRTTKVAGILVYTTFSGNDVDVVIGCGLNVLNPPPIASLASLLPPSSGQTLSIERTLAVLMVKFEVMWGSFVGERGSFEPFMDLYLNRWLHSDQLVTLTTTTPHQRVRIVGITADHGLLRTTPERGGYNEFIDLQPDGNSFDLMANLIMTKAR
ncbi:hypothetical protein BDY19DRAFT_994153 [Irpex rosettiformis]|uniref:Uncharacterized protein n=1 Tax=Irpex rosettiformis TaxID=378272 RepID=A0ACB8U1L2_9APHY|nr:hypothetical protein BDY19DRAFT_994153 [Irpex rosettiformis]